MTVGETFYSRYSGATQRARLLDAVTKVVAEKGYAGARVADIVAVAGVSRSSFYEHFEGKAQCLIDAYRTASTIGIEAVSAAAVEAMDRGWRAAAEAGLAAYFEAIRDAPLMARMLFLDFRSLGPVSIAESASAQSRYVEAVLGLQTALEQNGLDSPHRTGEELRLLFAGIEGRVAEALAAGDPGELDKVEAAAKELIAHLG